VSNMRTKLMLAMAAVGAASIATMVAQTNVYSVNAVGYVNIKIEAGKGALIANPLNNGGNTLNEILPTCADGSSVFIWDTTAQGWNGTFSVFTVTNETDPVNMPGYGQGVWDNDFPLPPGTGFLFNSGAFTYDITNTFVGEVPTGSLTNTLVPGLNLISSIVPIGGTVATVTTNLLSLDGDAVQSWDRNANGYSTTNVIFTGFGVAREEGGTWGAEGDTVQLDVGESFLYMNTGTEPEYLWIREFTIQ